MGESSPEQRWGVWESGVMQTLSGRYPETVWRMLGVAEWCSWSDVDSCEQASASVL